MRKIADIISDKEQGEFESDIYDAWHTKMLETMSDNLKTAEVIVQIQELLKETSVNSATKLKLLEFTDRLLGLQFLDRAQKQVDSENVEIPQDIQKLVDERIQAKSDKNWALADQLRNQIDDAGWNILDTKDGIKISKK